MEQPDEPRDIIATILAVALGGGFLVLALGAIGLAWSQGRAISVEAVQALTALGSGLVGVLGAYMGFRAGRRWRHRHDADTGPVEHQGD